MVTVLLAIFPTLFSLALPTPVFEAKFSTLRDICLWRDARLFPLLFSYLLTPSSSSVMAHRRPTHCDFIECSSHNDPKNCWWSCYFSIALGRAFTFSGGSPGFHCSCLMLLSCCAWLGTVDIFQAFCFMLNALHRNKIVTALFSWFTSHANEKNWFLSLNWNGLHCYSEKTIVFKDSRAYIKANWVESKVSKNTALRYFSHTYTTRGRVFCCCLCKLPGSAQSLSELTWVVWSLVLSPQLSATLRKRNLRGGFRPRSVRSPYFGHRSQRLSRRPLTVRSRASSLLQRWFDWVLVSLFDSVFSLNLPRTLTATLATLC